MLTTRLLRRFFPQNEVYGASASITSSDNHTDDSINRLPDPTRHYSSAHAPGRSPHGPILFCISTQEHIDKFLIRSAHQRHLMEEYGTTLGLAYIETTAIVDVSFAWVDGPNNLNPVRGRFGTFFCVGATNCILRWGFRSIPRKKERQPIDFTLIPSMAAFPFCSFCGG